MTPQHRSRRRFLFGRPRRRHSWLVVAVCLVAGGLLRDTGPTFGQDATTPPRVQVVEASPRGAVDFIERLTLVFDQPVAPLARLGHRVDRNALVTEPRFDGAARWLNSRTLILEFEDTPKPGTAIRYRLNPEKLNTTGRRFEGDLEWTVRVRPPRLLWSTPTPAEDEPVDLRLHETILAFSAAPNVESLSELTFTSAEGLAVPSKYRVLPESEWAAEGYDPAAPFDDDESPFVVAVTPDRPITSSGSFELVLDHTLAFQDTALPLEDAPIRFTYDVGDPPFVEDALAGEDGIVVVVSQPVTIESMRSATTLSPSSPSWRIDPLDPIVHEPQITSRRFRITGGPAGERVQLEIAPSLVDAAGVPSPRPFRTILVLPHLAPLLDIRPESGAIIPSPREFFSIEARNVGDVDIRAAWISNQEVPYLHAFLEAGASPVKPSGDPWTHPGERGWNLEDIWTAPALRSDTLHVWTRTFGAIEQRPHDAQALWVEATAVASLREGTRSDTLRTRRIFQVATLGLQVKLSRRHGLAWVSDLGTGSPAPSTEVSLFGLHPSPDVPHPLETPLWRGRTDENGLVWMPGLQALASRGIPRLALAENHAQRVWLELTDAQTIISQRDGGAVGDDGLRLAAALVHDRVAYRAGDTLYWKAYVRALDPKTLRVAADTPAQLVLRAGDTIVASTDFETNHIGSANGHVDLPRHLAPGVYTLDVRFRTATTKASIGTSSIQIVDALESPWTVTWDDGLPEQAPQGEKVTLSGRLANRLGNGVAGIQLEWTASALPANSVPPQWEGFATTDTVALDSLRADRGTATAPPGSGSVKTERDGRFEIEFELPETVAADLRVDLHLRPALSPIPPTGGRRRILALRDTKARAIVRVHLDRETAALAWDWGLLDEAGSLLEGQTAVVELYRARETPSSDSFQGSGPKWERLATHELESAASLRTFSAEAPEPGHFALRVRPANLGSAASRRLEVRTRTGNSTLMPSPGMSASMPVQLTPDGRAAGIEIPTPPGPASALLTVENGELVRARVTAVRGTPEMDVPLDATVTTHAEVHATIVGADAGSARTGTDARRRLPYRDRARAEISRPPTSAVAELRLDSDIKDPSAGSELHLTLELSDEDGSPLAGDLTVWMLQLNGPPPEPETLERETADADTEGSARNSLREFNPGVTLLDRRLGAVPTWDSRDDLLVAPGHEASSAMPDGASALEGSHLPVSSSPTNERIEGSDRRAPSLRLPAGRTVYWNPSVAIGNRGRTQIGLSLPDAPGDYAVFASAATTSGAFAGAVLPLRLHHPVPMDVSAPEWIRSGDRFESDCRIVNRSDRDLRGVVQATAFGGLVVGRDTRTVDLAPGESETWSIRVQSQSASEPADGALATRDPGGSPAEDILAAAGDQITLTFEFHEEDRAGSSAPARVERNVRIRRLGTQEDRIRTGTAGPRAVVDVDLNDPDLLLAGQLEAQLSPSFASMLEIPLRHLCERRPTSTEEWISHAFGLLTWLRLEPYLDSDHALAERRIKELETAASELQGRWNGTVLFMWSGALTEPTPHPAYLRGMLYWVLNEIARTGVEVSPKVLVELEDSFHRDSHDSARRGAGWLNDLAFHTWLRAEYGTRTPRIEVSDLEGLVVRQELLGDTGRVYLGLAYHALLRDQRAPQQEQALRARIQSIADALRGASSGETVLQLQDPAGPLTFASTADDFLRASALGVLFFSRIAPNSALMPNLVHTLLDARIRGDWPNPHESAHAAWALREYVEQVEHVRLPMQGRVVPGLGKATGAAFAADAARPAIVRYTLDELSRVRRRDRASDRIPLSFETNGVDPLYFTVRIPVPYPEGGLPYDEGVGITRVFVSQSKEQSWMHPREDTEHALELRRDHPLWVHLFVSLPEPASILTVQDALIPGAELLGDVQGAGIVESEVSGGTITVVLTGLESGVHEIRYPIVARTPGSYRLPAPKTCRTYQPAARGGDAMVSIDVAS